MTVIQAASRLGLSVAAVRTRLLRGNMHGIHARPRVWLIPRAEMERWWLMSGKRGSMADLAARTGLGGLPAGT